MIVISDLKQCFETLRTETERQSVTHQSMVTEMKTALEAPSADFILRLGNLKRGVSLPRPGSTQRV